MNIAIDIRPLMERHYTGVSLYTYHLLKSLIALDKKNKYYLFYNSFKNIKSRLPKFNSANVYYCGFALPNKLLSAALTLSRRPRIDVLINKKMNTRIDVFFMPNWQFVSLSPQCKKIITIHDLSCSLYPEFYSRKRRLWHQIINPPKLCRDFDHLMAVSKNTKKDLLNFYKIPPEKISVIYSGIKKEGVAKEALTAIKEKYNLPDKFILYLGALEPRKNIIGAIKSFELLHHQKTDLTNHSLNHHLVLAGPRGWLCRKIHNKIKQSRLKYKIHFIDYIEEKDKPSLYALAEIFFYPSFYEGFGFPPLEAMAAGAPVVASLVGATGETASAGALLVDPYNTAEMAAALRQLLTNEQLKKQLILRGQSHIQKFNWQKTATQTLNIFERLNKS